MLAADDRSCGLSFGYQPYKGLQAAVPLVYVPLEAVASKWYGESEGNLAKIFKAAEDLGGAILFLDEIDSLATERRRAPALIGSFGPAGRGRRHPLPGRV